MGIKNVVFTVFFVFAEEILLSRKNLALVIAVEILSKQISAKIEAKSTTPLFCFVGERPF